jgi:hypothetical protein
MSVITTNIQREGTQRIGRGAYIPRCSHRSPHATNQETKMTTIESHASALSTQPAKRGHVKVFSCYYKGKKLGPYYVRRWKIGKKLFKEYLKPKDVERVKPECQAHREGRKRVSNLLSNFEFLRNGLNRYDSGRVVTPAMEDYNLPHLERRTVHHRQTSNASQGDARNRHRQR